MDRCLLMSSNLFSDFQTYSYVRQFDNQHQWVSEVTIKNHLDELAQLVSNLF